MEELKPCPFCGCESFRDQESRPNYTDWFYRVICGKCFSTSEWVKGDESEAIEKWNTRPADRTGELEAELSACKESLQVAEGKNAELKSRVEGFIGSEIENIEKELEGTNRGDDRSYYDTQVVWKLVLKSLMNRILTGESE